MMNGMSVDLFASVAKRLPASANMYAAAKPVLPIERSISTSPIQHSSCHPSRNAIQRNRVPINVGASARWVELQSPDVACLVCPVEFVFLIPMKKVVFGGPVLDRGSNRKRHRGGTNAVAAVSR